MPVKVNLRHLEKKNLALEGELPASELELENMDELITTASPLQYKMEVEKSGDNLLLSGDLAIILNCECVRCLTPFEYPLELSPWEEVVPLSGEEAAPVVNDLVDLTPYLREDILLAFPQHPLCKPKCGGLPEAGRKKGKSGQSARKETASAWAELNKLKLK